MAAKEVTVLSTLGRTACLVGLTIVFMVFVRFCPPISHAVQWVAGTAPWQRLYDLFHVNGALGREQLMLSAIVIFCFALALSVQLAGLWLWRRLFSKAQ
ncbi:hypothetical protein [Saccharibacter sp. 17.LH.SD]|uniref:hypothetical protein n=1 Tax=Saccharibacter sp. 17.LH.SD TaxID=2689393 RepID=UPI00351AD086